MNPRAYWVGVSAALGVGGLIGSAITALVLEGRYRDRYIKDQESMSRTMFEFQKLHELKKAETPSDEPADFEPDAEWVAELRRKLRQEVDEVVLLGEGDFVDTIEVHTDESPDPYMRIVSDVAQFPAEADTVKEELNDFAGDVLTGDFAHYIDREEFESDDTRVKCLVEMHFVAGELHFLCDSEPMDDWSDRLGPNILPDFFTQLSPDDEQVLYVRNERTGEDFEVVRVANP